MSDQDLQKLAELRAKIDMADQSIHALLLQRAQVIDELIKAKGASKNRGAAFRPGREAQMMEVLKERHSGSIPFATIAHMWREIISTFTWLQAAYTVHIAQTKDNRLNDTVRYQFGFTVEVQTHSTIDRAMDAAQNTQNAIVVLETPKDHTVDWWRGIGGTSGLSVMARLPIVPVSFNAVDALVLAPPLSDPVPFEWRVYVVRTKSKSDLNNWDGGELLASQEEPDGGTVSLIAIGPGGKTPTELLDIRAAGGYFAPLTDE